MKAAGKKRGTGTSVAGAKARHAIFIEAYVANGGNGTQAAIKAGYSPRTAVVQAARLLRYVHVKQAVAKRRVDALAKAQDETGLELAAVLRELAALVHIDPRRLFDAEGRLLDPAAWPDDVAKAVASVEVTEEFQGRGESRERTGFTKKVKFWDKNTAIVSALKNLGGFKADNDQKPVPVLPPSIAIVMVAVGGR